MVWAWESCWGHLSGFPGGLAPNVPSFVEAVLAPEVCQELEPPVRGFLQVVNLLICPSISLLPSPHFPGAQTWGGVSGSTPWGPPLRFCSPSPHHMGTVAVSHEWKIQTR